MTRILALDPATLTGVAHSSGYRATWRLVVCDSEHRGLKLVRLRRAILDVAATLGVDLIAYENAAFGAGKRQMTTTAFHCRLAGVIQLVAAEIGAAFLEFTPTAIKKFATGSGAADKSQMIAAARSQLSVDVADDNQADALWVLELAKHHLAEQAKPRRKEALLWS
jgi:Holliday junction resolvasome RuvABC endonuclease subunit